MGLGFLWYVTKVLLLQLKIKWAGLLFLCGGGEKSPSATPPLLPSDSPERTSVGAPDLYSIPHLLSIHLYPSYSISACTFASNATVVGVQRSFCFGVFNPGFTQFFFLFFLWPPAQEPDERLHHRETAESNQRQELFHRIKSIFLTVLWGLTSVRKYVHLYPWKSKKYSCPALPLSWFRMGRCNLWLMSGVSGRKEGRKGGNISLRRSCSSNPALWFLSCLHVR